MIIEVIGVKSTENTSKRSGIHRIVLRMRVPKDIKIICFETVKEMLNRRQIRINNLNKYRKLNNKPILDSLPGIKPPEHKEDSLYFSLVSWSPIIDVDKLEILQKYL